MRRNACSPPTPWQFSGEHPSCMATALPPVLSQSPRRIPRQLAPLPGSSPYPHSTTPPHIRLHRHTARPTPDPRGHLGPVEHSLVAPTGKRTSPFSPSGLASFRGRRRVGIRGNNGETVSHRRVPRATQHSTAQHTNLGDRQGRVTIDGPPSSEWFCERQVLFHHVLRL